MTATHNQRNNLKTALFLTWLTVGWMVIEGVASLVLGLVLHSLLLEAFGLDSGLELISAFVSRPVL